MRPSRAGWVDRLPEHWREARARFVAAVNPTKSEVSHLDEGTEVTFVPMEAVSENGTIDISRNKMLAEVTAGYTYFVDGDVLVAKITPCFENGKAALAVGLTNGIGFGSTEFHVLRAHRGLDRRFLLHLVRSAPFREFGTASMYGAGGQKRVPTEFIMDFVIPLPPTAEQHAIADFLDCETAKIDALIATQERLIALLDEKRQATITHAVTKGLDPNAPMKEGGDELFPAIPAGWTVKRLKYLAGEVTVGVVVTPSKYYADSGVPALRSLNVRPMEIAKDELVFFDAKSNRILAKSMLRAGDLVAVRTGKPGTTAVIGDDLDGANCIDLILIRRSPRFDSRFLGHVLNSDLARGQFTQGSEGALQQHFNIETAKNLLFPVPPRREQADIARYLDNRLRQFDASRGDCQRMIDTLRERRTALITAAVTGQIDVSRAAITEAAE